MRIPRSMAILVTMTLAAAARGRAAPAQVAWSYDTGG